MTMAFRYDLSIHGTTPHASFFGVLEKQEMAKTQHFPLHSADDDVIISKCSVWGLRGWRAAVGH